MNEKETVIYEALELMGIRKENIFKLNEETFINRPSVAPNGMRYFSCSYGDYGWVMDEASKGITWGITDVEELENGSFKNINSPDAFNKEFVGGLKFNRRKFCLALEKLCEVEDRANVAVNVIFAVSDGMDEVSYVQIIDNLSNSWVL